MVDLRVDKAAEEIGIRDWHADYGAPKQVADVRQRASHADVFHSLRRVRDVVRGRSAKWQRTASRKRPLHVGPHPSQALTARISSYARLLKRLNHSAPSFLRSSPVC